MRDVLKRIIHHHRKLVSEQSIGPLHYEIADFLFEVLDAFILQDIVKFNNRASLSLSKGKS